MCSGIRQKLTHEAVGVKHTAHIQKGNELRDGNGHNQDRSPELLDLDALFVDHNGNKHTQEVVGEGGKERPHQRPGQSLLKGKTHTALAEVRQLLEIGHAHPAEQLGTTIKVGTVIGEGNEDHVDDRQHGEEHDACHGQRQQSLVETVVHQAAQILLAALDLLALGGDLHADTALLVLHIPGVHKGNDKQHAQQTVQQNTGGVVAVHPAIYVINGVVDIAALNGADRLALLQKVQLVDPVQTAAFHEHVEEENDFKGQEQKASGDLTVEQVAGAENKEGDLYGPVALPEGQTDVFEEIANADAAIGEESPDSLNAVPDGKGNGDQEQL